MATEKTPIRTVFADDGSAEGLAEFQSGEVIGYEHGGTGLDALGSANQVLQVSANGTSIVWGDKTQVDLDPYLQVANATSTFQTKVEALAANSALVSLIQDRIQVANVISLINTEISNLIDGAPGALDTLNELAAAIGDDANFITTITNDIATKSSNTYVHTTFVPKTASVQLSGDASGSATFASNTASITVDISSTGTPTGTFGSSSQVPIITVAADGRITNISNTSVAGVAGFTYASGNNTFTITTADGGVFSASVDELDTYQTKSEAVASNNNIVSLIEDRLQVSNAQSLFVNVSGDTMAGALAMGGNKITGLGAPTADTDASTKKYVDDEVASLVNSAPAALDTLNELAAALGDDANFATTVTNSIATKASNTYVNSTFQTIAVSEAYLANTNQAIATKISITDARAEFLQSGNTSVTADATSITVAQQDVDLQDRALVNPAGFLTINIGGVNYKLPYFS